MVGIKNVDRPHDIGTVSSLEGKAPGQRIVGDRIRQTYGHAALKCVNAAYFPTIHQLLPQATATEYPGERQLVGGAEHEPVPGIKSG
jgi:hypothetical protein